MQNELWRWSAVDLARGVASAAISSKEAVQSSLKRIMDVNPVLNAVVEVLAEQALSAADAADAAVKAGADLGPLHGVPVTIKVNVDQRGCATTNGVVDFRKRNSVLLNFITGSERARAAEDPGKSHRAVLGNHRADPMPACRAGGLDAAQSLS